ncbi:IS66 family insertion sequence element accessory protein TnpB [Lactobacillus delbrueckii subsp. bulgaricus]
MCLSLLRQPKRSLKALYWDGQGFWMLYKRFENGKLAWPNNERVV